MTGCASGLDSKNWVSFVFLVLSRACNPPLGVVVVEGEGPFLGVEGNPSLTGVATIGSLREEMDLFIEIISPCVNGGVVKLDSLF